MRWTEKSAIRMVVLLCGLQAVSVAAPKAALAQAVSSAPTATQLQGVLSAGSTSNPLTYSSNLSSLPVTVGGVTTSISTQIDNAESTAEAALAAATNGGHAGGDISNTTFLPAPGAAPASTGAKLARLPDPRSFGATGSVVRGVLYQSEPAGSTSLVLTDVSLNAGISPAVGAAVIAASGLLPTGTMVTSVAQNPAASGVPPTTTITLSAPLQAAASQTDPGSTYFDFAAHDDTSAFQQAYAAASANGVGSVHVSPGLYALSGSMPTDPNVSWELDNAELTQQGAILSGYNFGIQRQPSGKLFVKALSYPDNENNLAIETSFLPTNSNHQYQKNALSLQVYDDDPSCLSELTGTSCNGTDGSADIGRGTVGLSIQANPDASNTSYNLWGQETQITLPAGSAGAVTDAEFAIVNNSGVDNLEMGSLFNQSAATFLGNGSNIMAAAIWVAGAKWQTGIDISTSVLGKAWAVRTEGARGAGGLATTHTDMAYVDHAGNLFAQSLHIASGGTTGDTDPSGGLTINGGGNLATPGALSAAQAAIGGVAITTAATGQIDLGNATLAGGNAPVIRMHAPSGAAADAYDLALQDTGSALRVIDGAGNQLAYISAATGLQGATISVSNTDGVVANFGSSLALQLTGSGFDMINEVAGKAFAVHTNAGYNATFNANGSTSFGGAVIQTATDAISAAGVDQPSATPLSSHVNRLTSCASGGVALPSGAPAGVSSEIVVLNRSANACQVYPPAGGSIENNAAGAPVAVAAGSDTVFRSMSPTAWYQ